MKFKMKLTCALIFGLFVSCQVFADWPPATCVEGPPIGLYCMPETNVAPPVSANCHISHGVELDCAEGALECGYGDTMLFNWWGSPSQGFTCGNS